MFKHNDMPHGVIWESEDKTRHIWNNAFTGKVEAVVLKLNDKGLVEYSSTKEMSQEELFYLIRDEGTLEED